MGNAISAFSLALDRFLGLVKEQHDAVRCFVGCYKFQSANGGYTEMLWFLLFLLEIITCPSLVEFIGRATAGAGRDPLGGYAAFLQGRMRGRPHPQP